MSMTRMWWWNVRDRTVVGTGSEGRGPGERGQGILMLAAAALLALCGGLALPATAEAQTTLVSNIGQGGGLETTTGSPWAQKFTTGRNAGGYTLTAVDVVSFRFRHCDQHPRLRRRFAGPTPAGFPRRTVRI